MTLEKSALNFLINNQLEKNEHLFYCETRAIAAARLEKWIEYFKRNNTSENQALLLGAILGELTNNSFDHNLGHWKDTVGCIVGIENLKNQFKIYIVDRGQGLEL